MAINPPIWRRAITIIRWVGEAYGLLQLFAAAGFIAVTFAVLGIFSDRVPDAAIGWQILLGLGIVTLWLVFIWLVAPLVMARLWNSGRGGRGGAGGNVAQPEAPPIEFYLDRDAMRKARGGLLDELQSCTRVWAAWYAGTYAAASEIFARTGKPQRLILLNPDSLSTRLIASTLARSQEQLIRDIQTTTKKALDAGISVRQVDRAILPMVIGEPESGKGWVRAEIAIPFSGVRPNVIIRQEQQPELFQEFVRAFKTMWDDPETIQFVGAGEVSTPNPQPAPGTSDSPPPPTS